VGRSHRDVPSAPVGREGHGSRLHRDREGEAGAAPVLEGRRRRGVPLPHPRPHRGHHGEHPRASPRRRLTSPGSREGEGAPPSQQAPRDEALPAPAFHCASKERRARFWRELREFLAAFYAAAERLAAGDLTVEFPAGSFPPPRQFVPIPGRGRPVRRSRPNSLQPALGPGRRQTSGSRCVCVSQRTDGPANRTPSIAPTGRAGAAEAPPGTPPRHSSKSARRLAPPPSRWHSSRLPTGSLASPSKVSRVSVPSLSSATQRSSLPSCSTIRAARLPSGESAICRYEPGGILLFSSLPENPRHRGTLGGAAPLRRRRATCPNVPTRSAPARRRSW
jgi:hypothetical protein